MQFFAKIDSVIHTLLNSPNQYIAYCTGGFLGAFVCVIISAVIIGIHPALYIPALIGFIIRGTGGTSTEI